MLIRELGFLPTWVLLSLAVARFLRPAPHSSSHIPRFSSTYILKNRKVSESNSAAHILLEILAIPDILCYNNYGATEKRQAVSPLHFRRGASCSPVLKERGGYSMSTSEVLQLCLVIIGICGLFLQAYKKK